MRKYLIINIQQSTVVPEGEVLIVKANPCKRMNRFEELETMFGKKYYNFNMNECNETEIFMLPFSESYAQKLAQLARRYDDGDFWNPDMDEFYDATLRTPNGVVMIHKSCLFKNNELQKYIPPIAKLDIHRKIVGGIRVLTVSTKKAIVEDNPDGSFTWSSGNITHFVFPDNSLYRNIIDEIAMLNPHEKEFWIPDTSDFCHAVVNFETPFGISEHDLYISDELPEDCILNDLEATIL